MILAATGGLAIVVTVAFVGLLSSTDRLRAASDRRARSEAVIASANATEKLLLDLETGERGFVITDQPRFLQPWLTALKAFPASAARLAALVRDEPAQYRLASAIQSAGAAYVTDWTEPVIAAERRSPARARALVATAGGKRRVDAMRAQFKRLVANEQALADTRTSEADHAASVAQVFGVAGLAGSIAVIALFAFLLPRSVLGPFRRLRAAADRIAGGDLSARADADGPREMAALTQSFNAMAQALEHNHAALAHATEVAQNANHAKSEFLARMSHELRTPLNAIIGFSQLLQLDELAPSQSENVGFVLTAGRHLLELINEVLDLARIESGKLAFSPEPVPLAATVRDALALVTPLAQQNDVALHSQADRLAPDLHVRADQHRLKQVLLNLLANAIKYNRPGGWVEISFAVTDGGRVRTRIADNGIGIQPDQLEHLFEPFERLGAELTGVEGTGLGLALSKRLIEVMGGTIDADSQPGSGTTFTIELTTAQLPTGRHEPGPHDQAPSQLDSQGTEQHTILYIEDNLSNLTLVERILERHPRVELIPAMQGRLGLELAREHHPDLIVLDLHLPDMPGIEVLKRLKADPRTREIPVVVLTADATIGQAERLRRLGAAEHMTKPLDVPRFLEVIAASLTPNHRAAA